MSEWGDWCEMRKVIRCSVRGCTSRAYAHTRKCALHSKTPHVCPHPHSIVCRHIGCIDNINPEHQEQKENEPPPTTD